MQKETIQSLASGRWMGRVELLHLPTGRILFAGFREIRITCIEGVRSFQIVNSARFDYRFPALPFNSRSITARGEMIQADHILRVEELRYLRRL